MSSPGKLFKEAIDEIYNKQNLDAVEKFFVDGRKYHTVAGTISTNKDELKQLFEQIFNSSSETQALFDNVFTQGDMAAIQWTLKITKKDGEIETAKLCSLSRWVDGKTVEGWDYSLTPEAK